MATAFAFSFDATGAVVAETADRSSPLAIMFERDICLFARSLIRGGSQMFVRIDEVRRAIAALRRGDEEKSQFHFDATRLLMTRDAATVRIESRDGALREDHLAVQDLLDLLLSLRTLCAKRMAERLADAILSLPVIRLHIEEEYGFRHWIAVLTSDEYRDLIRRWETMRGLSCLVPVDLIVPQAVPVTRGDPGMSNCNAECHIHESGDSFLDGSAYMIPDGANAEFWIDGKPFDTLEGYRECPDVLVSRVVSVSEIQAILTEILPGTVVVARSEWDKLPTSAIGAAALCEDAHPDWPRRLLFPMLPVDHTLGAHPHLAIAAHIAERMGTTTLTSPMGLVDDSQIDAEVLAECVNGEWWLARQVHDERANRVEVRLIARARTVDARW